MGDEIKEECGISGIYSKNPNNESEKLKAVPECTYHQLSALQHRGQLSVGMAVHNPFFEDYEFILKRFREVGLVDQAFRPNDPEHFSKIIEGYRGTAAIGHVRYATVGFAKTKDALRQEAQPFYRKHGRLWKRFCVAMNGTLANYDSLRAKIIEEGYHLDTHVDTEIIEHLFSLSLKKFTVAGNKKPDIFEVAHAVMERLDGGYVITLLFGDGDILFLRDPYGIRPAVYGENSDYFGIASESVALEKIGINSFEPLPPGSATLINKKGIEQKILISSCKRAHCHFEHVYFARAQSWIDGRLVDSSRGDLGRNLARSDPALPYFRENKKNVVVIPIPNTGIGPAEAYANEGDLYWSMALEKENSLRLFINSQSERQRISRKCSVFPERIRGKIAVVVDDSVVRGETGKARMKQIKDAGAKEVHLRLTCPPIRHPCYYGVDFPTYKELFASGNEDIPVLEKRLADTLEINSVHYQRLEGLIDAIGLEDNLCLACLTGEYPTSAGQENAKRTLKREFGDQCDILE